MTSPENVRSGFTAKDNENFQPRRDCVFVNVDKIFASPFEQKKLQPEFRTKRAPMLPAA